MKLYFIRHGESVFNKKKRFQGHLPGGLSEEGINQAKAAIEEVQKLDFEVVYSSDLERALETAKIITQEKAPIITDERLREQNFGQFQNQIIEQRMRDELYEHRHQNEPYKGAETDRMIQIRLRSFLEELGSKAFKSVLIVSHNGTIVQAKNAIDPEWNSKKLQNCQIFKADLGQVLAKLPTNDK